MAGRMRRPVGLGLAALLLGTAGAVMTSEEVRAPEIEHGVDWVRDDDGAVEAYRITIHNDTGRITRVRCTVEVVSAAANRRVLAKDTFHTDEIAPGGRVVRERGFEEVPRRPGLFEISAEPHSTCAAIGR